MGLLTNSMMIVRAIAITDTPILARIVIPVIVRARIRRILLLTCRYRHYLPDSVRVRAVVMLSLLFHLLFHPVNLPRLTCLVFYA